MALERVLELDDLYRVFNDELHTTINVKYLQIREHLVQINPDESEDFYDKTALYRTMQYFKSVHHANSKEKYRG